MKTIVIIIGLSFVLYNWVVFYNIFFRKSRASWIPVVGGIFLALGIYLYENSWWWIAFLIDYGSLPGFLYNFFLYRWIDPLVKDK
ncbi:hypothetical protein M5C99_09155 [Acidovorax sp. NCPPB 2350]|nr:hypothetical protein M5C99_09155 [Acidovorax sp. NCPPB 2350]